MTRILGPRGSRRRRRMLLPSILLIAAATVLIVARAGAANQGGFEIDAGVDNATHSPALYSGTLPTPGDDWVQGSSNQGVFSSTGTTPAQPGGTGCYGSNIFLGGAVSAASSAFICDGNSDPKLKDFPEKNIVSPSGKTPDASWPIKPGNVRPKNDFSHAYVYTKTAHSPCHTSDPNSQDPMLYLGGHVGDNEGDHFWGFEFDKNAPTNFDQLKNNSGNTFNLIFNRSIGDILVSITVPGTPGELPALEIFKVTGFNADGSAIFTPAGPQAICPPSAPQGLSEVATNATNDILAPPWNVPVCDPTSENGSNSCRLANGNNTPPANKLLATRDFAEASVDLFAFGINPCFSNVIFTSRSAHVLEGADVQDVGGADIPLCGKKTGTKFEDLNGNGVKDSGEPGLNGWPINLYRDAGTIGTLDAADDNDPATPGIQPFQSVTTSTIDSVIGSYAFANLQNGRYIVCEAQNPPAASGLPPTGWHESLPNASTPPPSGETNADCTADSALSGVGYAFNMSGQTQSGNDFGNFMQGTKSGTKFKDLNANGVRDLPDDVGLSGWEIRAYVDTNGDGTLQAGETTIAASTNTDASGNYTLSLNPGKYVVCEALQATWFQSAPSNSKCSAINPGAGVGAGGYAVTITSRSTETGNLFGNFQQGTKSGAKFNDLNANGVRDLPGDVGLSGWTIRAYVDTNGDGALQAGETTISASALTDASGNYTLTLNPGKYVVCEVLQATWFQSAPSNTKCAAINPTAGVGNGGFAVTITSGSTETDNLFGNFQQGTKSGTKFNDLNANGVRDLPEDVGLPGWTIRAYVDTNGDGTLQAGETTIATSATTNASGAYTLTLNPGKYVVCEALQATWFQSAPNNMKCAAINPGAGVGNGGFAVTITSGSTETGNDFGNFQQGTKSGTKFKDVNANGARDLPDDVGLPGWGIVAYVDTNGDGTLQDGETTLAASTTTDANGNYTLTLNPGKYVVCEVLQATWIQSAPSNSKCSAINPGAGVGNGGFAVTITSGSTETGNLFGNFQQSTIAGTKFKDINNNHARDAGEGGLEHWTIHVYDDSGGTAGSLDATDVLVDTQVTDATGGYTTVALTPGTYYVCEVGQSNWLQTYPQAATVGSTSCSAKDGGVGWKVVITSGTNATLKDFGNTPLSHLTVNFFSDAQLFGGGDATHATSIACTDAHGNPVNDQDATGNGYLSPSVTLDQSTITCTITFVDP